MLKSPCPNSVKSREASCGVTAPPERAFKIEFDTEENWGGNAVLSNGETWWVKPGIKKLPKEELRKKISD